MCKIALLVGEDTLIDYALPAGVALIAVIEDLIPRVNGILRKRGAATLDDDTDIPPVPRGRDPAGSAALAG